MKHFKCQVDWLQARASLQMTGVSPTPTMPLPILLRPLPTNPHIIIIIVASVIIIVTFSITTIIVINTNTQMTGEYLINWGPFEGGPKSQVIRIRLNGTSSFARRRIHFN